MRSRVIRASQLVIDLVVLTMAFAMAFLIRFDWQPPTEMVGRLTLVVPYVVAGEYLVLLLLGVPRFSWRYIGLREAWRILVAALVANLLLLASRLAFGELQYEYGYLRHGVIPFGVIASNLVLMFLAVAGVRIARRVFGERLDSLKHKQSADRVSIPTMLVGAGAGGALMTKELMSRPDLGITPVGFVDDDAAKHGSVVNGVPVLGASEDLGELCEKAGAEQVLITIPSAPGSTIRRIRALAEAAGREVRIIPGLYEILGGSVSLSRVRPVAIEDLLRREPVELDAEAIAEDIEGRVVLVTGAGGSIGSELCRQLARYRPSKLLLAERAENNLFHIHRELVREHPELSRDGHELVPLIADVTDQERMKEVFERYRPSTVYHAAAHKHVPMMEWNPGEAVKNNVLGTTTVAELARAYGAESFVMISTDKAVNPTSVMGATKRVAESVVQSLASFEVDDPRPGALSFEQAGEAAVKTRFVTVRFGNVLGSAGSVIPIFKEQIKKGGPITVTHPEMRRYFMTIPEACQLVLQAGAMGEGGEIFILDMGEPVKIVDLARDLIALSGLREGEDIEIVFSGVRPGEKLYEELSLEAEHAKKTRHPKIFVGQREALPWERVEGHLKALREVLLRDDPVEVKKALRACVPEFQPPAAEGQGSSGGGASGRGEGQPKGESVDDRGSAPAARLSLTEGLTEAGAS